MNTLQTLIIEMQMRQKSHLDKINKSQWDTADYNIACGREMECDFIIQKLTLLLKDESKQPQPPDFANTMLGEVPQVVNDQQGENIKAVEGATPVVKQNEQTKEVCHCIWPIRDTNDPDLCAYCLKEFVG